MIKLIIKLTVAAILIATSILNAQNFQGQAFYESKVNMAEDIEIETPNLSEEIKKNMLEMMKKSFEKSYILSFNKTESIYEEEQKLDAPSPSNGGGMMIKMANFSGGKRYKNIKDKTTISEEDFLGKEFLVTDSLPTYQWKLEETTKKIGEYTCYKATYVIPVSEKEIKEYEEFKNKKNDGKTQLFLMKEPKEKRVTVWYTPEIPISQGPEEYWGLPGLILEVNFGKTTILCSKIILNPKEKTTIKELKKGKKVTSEEYERLIEQQMELMNNQKAGEGEFKIQIRG